MALGSKLCSDVEESKSEESDDDQSHRRPAPKSETTEPQAKVGGRRGQKGSRPKSGPKDDDDDLSLSLDDEGKATAREAKRGSDVSKVPSGAKKESIQEVLKGLRKLQESVEKLQSDFLEGQTEVITT